MSVHKCLEQEISHNFYVEAIRQRDEAYTKLANQEKRVKMFRDELKKIAKRWFDPNKERSGICSACYGGMHGLAAGRKEYHDKECPYDIAQKVLEEKGS